MKKSSSKSAKKAPAAGKPAKRKSYRTPKIHIRTAASKSSPVRCQRRSQSSIWQADLQSVAPQQSEKSTCGRCKRARVGA